MKKTLLFLLMFFINATAWAQNSNYGFENGNYSEWTASNGNSTIRTTWGPNGAGAQVSTGANNFCTGNGLCWNITPYGQYMLALQPGSGSPTFDNAATGIGLTAAQISAIRSYLTFQSQNGGGGSPTPTNATSVRRTVYLEVGRTYTYAWNYVSTDYTPFNDGSLVTVTGGPGSATVNNETGGYALLGFTNPGTGNYATNSYGSTGWQLVQFTVTVSGTYTLGFMVFNLGDTALSPVLFIDEITGATQLNGENFGPIAPNSGSNAPSTPTEPAGPTYCCGGSAAPFSANSTHVANVTAFTNRSNKDSKVIIQQVGSDNSITVSQTGTENNYFKYYSSGNNNTTVANQSGANTASTNYVDITVTGNSNSTTINQSGTGTKGVFAVIDNNSNLVNIQQEDSGSHYLDLSISGSNKTVTVVQEGSAAHMALINLSGNATNIDLTQSGSTQNFYSIVHSCATVGGCGTITVTQGP